MLFIHSINAHMFTQPYRHLQNAHLQGQRRIQCAVSIRVTRARCHCLDISIAFLEYDNRKSDIDTKGHCFLLCCNI